MDDGWVWFVFGGTLILFVLAIIIFTAYFKQQPTYKIFVENKTGFGINVQIGMLYSTSQTNVLNDFLNNNSTMEIDVTPGVSLAITGLKQEQQVPSLTGTSVIFNFPNEGYLGPYYLIHQGKKVNVSTNSFSTIQEFGVSLAAATNMKAEVKSNSGCSIKFSTGIPESACPSELRYGSPYIGCLNPCWVDGNPEYCCMDGCSTPCEASWPSGWYEVFKEACPDCMITNCDLANQTPCPNKGSFNTYTITFTNVSG